MAVNVKGTAIPTFDPPMPIVPVYCSSGRLAAGLSSMETVVEAPGASEGIVAGDASERYDAPGRLTWRAPLAAPPRLVTVNVTMVWVPTSMPELSDPGLTARIGVCGRTDTLSGMSSVAPWAVVTWIVTTPVAAWPEVATKLYARVAVPLPAIWPGGVNWTVTPAGPPLALAARPVSGVLLRSVSVIWPVRGVPGTRLRLGCAGEAVMPTIWNCAWTAGFATPGSAAVTE